MKRLFLFFLLFCCFKEVFAQNASLTVAGGKVVVAAGSYLVLHDTQFNAEASFTATSGTISFKGTASDNFNSISGSFPSTFNNLYVEKTSNNFLVGQDITINDTLDMSGGKIIPQSNYGITIGPSGSIINASSSRYINTANGIGLKRTVSTSRVNFPVGNSAYNPIDIENNGTVDVYGVAVADEVLTNGYIGTVVTDHAVSRTWLLSESISGGSHLNLVTRWNISEELTGWQTYRAPTSVYHTGSWQGVNSGGYNSYEANTFSTFSYGITTLGPVALFVDPLTVTPTIHASKSILTSTDVGAAFTLKATYNLSMNTSVMPVFSFPTFGKDPVSAGILIAGPSSWTNQTTYEQTFTVADPDVEMTKIDVQVSGGINDSNLYSPAPFTATELFHAYMDVQPPVITPRHSRLIDDFAGVNKFWLKFTFSLPMDITVEPVVSFPEEDPVTPGNLTPTYGTWTDNTTFVQYYTATDMNNLISGIDVQISGARFADGTAFSTYSQDNIFTVSNLIQPPKPKYVQFRHKYNSIYIEFDIQTNYGDFVGTLPKPWPMYLAFTTPGEDPMVFTEITEYNWISRYFLQAIIKKKDGMKADMRNIDVQLITTTPIGRKDDPSNSRSEFDVMVDEIDVDFWDPEVASVTPSLRTITDQYAGNNAFNIKVKFANRASGTPVITFPTAGEAPESALTFNHGVWGIDSTYTAYYDVLQAGLSITNIDIKISGAKDLARTQSTQAMADTIFTDVFSMNITTLPVTLSRFEGKLVKDCGELSWTTHSENNNEGFEIESSQDAKNFTRIGFIAGHGTSITQHKYLFTDCRLETGITYYRLKQKDLDGKFTYSGIIAVNSIKVMNPAVKIYPNPVLEVLTIDNQEPGAATGEIFNMLGQQVLEINLTQQITNVQLPELPKGIYVIHLINNQGKISVAKFRKE